MPSSILRRLRRHRASRSRGQAIVEFALVLPILLMLVLMGLDFGRVYLGWINLQSMSRIAANFAANSPDAWGASPDTTKQTQYRNQILADATANNCKLPESGGAPAVPAPTFADINGGGIGLGDTATVQLTCQFSVITPVISNIVGNTVAVSASSTFTVKSGMSAVAGAGGGGGGAAPVAAFTGNGVVATTGVPPVLPVVPTISNTAPFTVEFRDTSGGAPTSWHWDFGDGTTFDHQDPLIHNPFTCALPLTTCTKDVQLTATNTYGSTTAHMTVNVVESTTVNFTANTTVIDAGQSVTFTDASTAGATAWSWDFGDGTAAGTGATVTHPYASATNSPFTVTLTVTYPSPIGVQSLPKAGFIVVNVPQCTVPTMSNNNTDFNAAAGNGGHPGTWANAGFTGEVTKATGSTGNFLIKSQSLTAGSLAPCTSDVTVGAS